MDMTCTVDGCGRIVYARGWCNAHYKRALKNDGDPGPATVRRRGSAPASCTFEGCGRKHFANDLCAGHNQQRAKGQQLRTLRQVQKGDLRDGQGRKRCTSCGEWLAPARFYCNKSKSDGLDAHCRECRKGGKLRDAYGMTPDQYDQLLTAQGGVCAICGGTNASDRALAVDHDHACCPGAKTCGACVRALLCQACNQGLGNFRDQPQRLRDAAAYLERFS